MARIDGVCSGRAAHHHHRQLRRFGDDSPENLIPVCPPCHVHIHTHVQWAYDHGLLVHSWDDPAVVDLIEGATP